MTIAVDLGRKATKPTNKKYGQERNLYNAEPQMTVMVLAKVEKKIGRAALNLTVKFVSKISDPINTVYTGSEVNYVYCNIQNRFLMHTKA